MEVAITKRSSENLGGFVEIPYTVDFGDQSIAPALQRHFVEGDDLISYGTMNNVFHWHDSGFLLDGAQDLLLATELTILSGEVYAVLGQYPDEHLSPWRARFMTGRYHQISSTTVAYPLYVRPTQPAEPTNGRRLSVLPIQSA